MTEPVTEVTINGEAIHGIQSLFDELNRVLVVGTDWSLGPSLDALDDVLYGGYGLLAREDRVRVVWLASGRSREALGLATTLAWYDAKLASPEHFDSAGISARRDALLAGTGPTYFEIVLEIFADHPEVELVLR